MTKTINLICRVFGLTFSILIVNNAFGQTSAGSVYSIFGIGELQPQASIQSRGMGFASIALSSPYWANTVNPAANTEVGGSYYTHIFDFGLYYSKINYDKTNTSESLTNGGISHMSFWLRFSPKWTGTVGISPFSKVGYDISANDIVTSEGNTYNVNYVGSGGLNQLYFGQSYEVFKNLTLGVKMAYIMGNLRHEQNVTNTSNSGSFSVVDQTSLHKFSFDYGLNYKIPIKNSSLNIGLIYNTKRELTGTSRKKLTDPDVEVIYDESEDATSYILPEKMGGGISFVSNKLVVSSDIEFNRWSEAVVDGSDNDLNDTWRYAVGIEFTPDFEGPYLARVNYRAGYFIENSYLTVEKTTFNTWGITTGLGIPIRSNGALNISYVRKVNGTLSNGLILENTNEITLGVSIRNSWFKRNKYN